ncbi:MAG: DegT/DnrJ/EryC1/StrS family aminotransferase [Acidaminococcaceae bacterium]|nr:DegT/DnrJ/EryC1/StrS family aminotransferase [Acidaminococcaceae bacterium]
MALQVLKPKFHTEECLEEIRECLDCGWPGVGYKTVQFEEAWKKYTGHAHAYYLCSNSVGLHLAVKILKMQNGWQDRDEIISTPITFVVTNHAIMYENLHPVFADVDEYLCLDPKDVEKKITAKTRAVVFVGYGGRTGRLKEIIEICRKHHLKLILDAAHMAGTRVDGVFPGTWEGIDVTVYSFQPVKNLPTGDSGMICWADVKGDEITRQLAWFGLNKDTYARRNQGTYAWQYDVNYLGYKYNGNSVMAAIALVQLKYLDEDNARRRSIVNMYNEAFKDNPSIKIIPFNNLDECSCHIYVLAVPDRNKIMDELERNGIYAGVHYRDNTEYAMYSYAHGTCPHAHSVSDHLITLPMHLWMTDGDVGKVIKIVNQVLS